MPLGPWAIAKRSLRIEIVFSISSLYHLLVEVMDKALTFKLEGPGFKSQLRQWNSFKNYKISFLIEDTSELECWTLVKYPKRHSNMSPVESLTSPGESLTARRKVRICWLSSGLIDFPQGSWWLSLGVTKDELECLQGIWDRSCIPRSPQNDSSPPYRKLENGRKYIQFEILD